MYGGRQRNLACMGTENFLACIGQTEKFSMYGGRQINLACIGADREI